jgi:PAS domain S-box-containing protein
MRESTRARTIWPLQAAAGLVVGFASLRFLSVITGLDLPVDQILFRDQVLASPFPARMAANTALAFVCLGTALLTLDGHPRRSQRFSEPLLLASFALSLMAVVGYLYGASPIHGLMAFNVAAALLLLSTSALFARPDRGLVGLLLGDSPGGVMTRRVLPLALAAPLLLGWLRLQGQRAGLFGLEIGTGLLALTLAGFLVALVWTTALHLDAAHRARRAVEEALHRSLERHSRLLESNLIGVLTATSTGTIQEANHAFLHMLGYGPEDLPLDSDTITAPECRDLNAKARQEIAERGMATPFEKEYLRKDGSRVRALVGASVLTDSDGEVMAFVVDLSARKEAELEVERMRGFLDSILENLPTMMFVKDARELRFVQFNRAGEELLGFTRDELLGKNDYDFFPRAEADFFTAKDQTVLETGQLLDVPEEPIQTKSGEVRILHTKKVPILDRDGSPRYLLGISEDITERKRAERQLAALNEGLRHRTAELEAANKELEAFSYSVSHDLRAPLRHIDGFADLLMRQSRAVLDDKGRGYLDAISSSAKSMGQLIDDLLAFSRMGRTQMQQASVDLSELVDEVRQQLREPAASAEWRTATLPVVRGDAAMLRLVFTNLLSNALKYAGHNPRPVIEVGAQASEDEVIVFVRDNGVGFDMKYAHKLFGVFQRLHSDDEFEGTGIGLANVRRVVHRHGGRVWAEGVVDGGATFYVALPRSATGEGIQEAA